MVHIVDQTILLFDREVFILVCANEKIILTATIPQYYGNGRFIDHFAFRRQLWFHNYFM